MTGQFDRLLTSNETWRFHEALERGAVNIGSMDREATPAMAPEMRRPTEYEERIWLAQQQDPDAVYKRLLAYRLDRSLSVAKLTRAIQAAIRSMPELNTRYRFDDDGVLRRYPGRNAESCIEVLRAESDGEAITQILARQASPWDSEHNPPFHVLLIQRPEQVLLAFFIHRIVDETCPAEIILRAIARAYEGQAAIQRETNPAAMISDMTTRPAPVAWMQGNRDSPTVATITENDIVHLTMEPVAWRYRVEIAPEALNLFDQPLSNRLLLATVATRFAYFVCDVGRHDRLDLVMPGQPEHWLSDNSPSLFLPDLLRVSLAREQPLPETIETVVSCLDKRNMAFSSARRAGVGKPEDSPQLFVSLLTAPHFFNPESLNVEHMPLPSLEPHPDLSLATGFTKDGNLILELTAGQAVSRHAGAFLLERFAGFLQTGKMTGFEQHNAAPLFQTDVEQVSSDDPAVEADMVTALILAEFRAALASPEMGCNDDFFDHGGHSLTATRIIGRLLTNHGIEIHFNDLFSHPSAAALARLARLTGTTAPALPAPMEDEAPEVEDRGPEAPLSLAQMSLWKAYAAFGFSEIFNLPFALDFLAPVDEGIFARAFLDILERHAGLRTLFSQSGETVSQRIVPISELQRYKWFWTSQESAGIDRHSEALHHFDLARELPLRLRFLRDPATGRQTLSFLFHHIVLDEWSVNLMMDELADAYRARAAGQAPVWDTVPAPFHEFARQQNAASVNEAHVAYWTERLRDAPHGLSLFAEEVAGQEDVPAETSVAGGWVEIKLEHEVSEGLYTLAKENGASLFNVVYAGIATALRRLGAPGDLVVGTSASGRTDAAFFDTIGYFTTVVAHRIVFRDDTSVGALVEAVKNTINESMPHTCIPIDLVEEALGMSPGRDHLFGVFIQLHAKNKLNGILPAPDGGEIEFRQIDPERHESMHGLQFEVMEETIDGQRRIRILMSYRADQYGPDQVKRIGEATEKTFELFSRPRSSRQALATLK